MTGRLRRREFITLLGGAAACPLAARAQQLNLPVIGYVNAGPTPTLAAFRQGLNEAGILEGRDFAIETRFTEGQLDRAPPLIADLVRRQVAVIAVAGIAGALAAKAATTSIPIVFGMGEDPVSFGLVASMNRPGGNITGISYSNSAIVPKRLELLRELVPQVQVFAALINPKSPNADISTRDTQDAASKLGLQIHILRASTADELDKAFATLVQVKAGALLIAPDGLFITNATQIAVLAARYGIPASHEFRSFPVAGGLMSYGGSNVDGWRQLGLYAGRILKGEKPADLPILQPTKFELVINLKTARALGITVPPTLLVAADEVIE